MSRLRPRYAGPVPRGRLRFLSQLDRLELQLEALPNGCWVWRGTRDKDGYGVFTIQDQATGKQRKLRAHRVAWEFEHLDSAPHNLELCHSCDNPPCCNPAHLAPGTRQKNAMEAVERGRHAAPRGSSHYSSKLTEANVREMRRRAAAGESSASLGREFGVSPSVASQAINRKSWRHVQ